MARKKINLRNFEKKIRTDKDFIFGLRGIIPKRLNNFPEESPRELSDRELTRMLKNTEGFEKALEEMATLPRSTCELEDLK